MGGVSEPGINVLTASGQDQAKEPAVAASSLGLQQVVANNILNNPGFSGKLDFRPESPDNLSKLAKK